VGSKDARPGVIRVRGTCQPALNAAVVYYGDAPGSADNSQEAALANLKAPVLGLYAGNDADGAADRSGDEEARQEL
jgi:dienelactone hydrolase